MLLHLTPSIWTAYFFFKMIWFLSDYDFSARCWERNADTHTQKEKQGEQSPAWVKHQWEELQKVMACGGEGGMMKRRSSLTFEEPVENVGTTSKRAPWNIQHTTASVVGKPRTSRCAVFQLVVFGPGLAFDIYFHRSDKQRYLRRPCETRAAEIQTCFFVCFCHCIRPTLAPRWQELFFSVCWQWIRCSFVSIPL